MAKKSSNRNSPKVILDPLPGSTKPVRSLIPGMTVGTLCTASGTAPAPPAGFILNAIYALITPGEDSPATENQIQFLGVSPSSIVGLNWAANQQLQAYLPSLGNPLGWNTLHVLYKYFKNFPPAMQTVVESISFKGQFTMVCLPSAFKTTEKPKEPTDILPSERIGKTYIYQNIPVTQADGVRLMHNKTTPLHPKLVAVAAPHVDWTPNPLTTANLHRPIGELEFHQPQHEWELQSRFRLMPRNAIILSQPSSSRYAVTATSIKQPDILEFVNPVLDLFVGVNDLVDPLGTTDPFADNTGTFDLVVKVLKSF